VGLKYPSDYLKLGKGIRKSKSNFLVQEAWLTISDYLYSLIYAFYLPFKVRVYPQFRGYKVECLLSTEIMKDIASPALMKALYRYRFIRRLKKEKVRICGAIDWNENQIIDRAMNMGFKKFFPELVVNGYQGFFVLEQYASLQPTCYEKELGTIPDCIYVVSDYCKSRMLEVCSKLNVKVASAFRFSHLFSMQDHRSEDNPIILVALPNMIDEAKPIVNAAINLASALHSNVTFILKHHPGCTKEILQKHIPEITNSVFKYTDEMMPALLSKASVVISSASSVCIESVAVGIPTAIHGSRYGITLNPIPSYVSDKIWTVFYTSEQLEKFVRSALTLKERNCISEKLFHPIDELGTRSLFKFK